MNAWLQRLISEEQNTADPNGNHPVTKAELQVEIGSLREELRAEIRASEERLVRVLEDRLVRTFVNIVAQSQAEILAQTQEYVRDAQTELLRGFGAFQTSQSVQFRRLKADLSNVDASADQRLTAVEQRLLEIEKRPPPLPQPKPPAAN